METGSLNCSGSDAKVEGERADLMKWMREGNKQDVVDWKAALTLFALNRPIQSHHCCHVAEHRTLSLSSALSF